MTRTAWFMPALAALALILAASGGNDVVGYRSGKNVWLLGAKLKDVNLSGFREMEVDNDQVTAFLDPSRTIQFSGEDTDVAVALFEHNARLCSVVLSVPPTERPFKSLRKYYAGRLAGCDQTLDEADHCVWCDDEDDFLILIKDATTSGDPVSLVMYVRGTALLGTSGPTVPAWLRELLSG
jgi:hypothetical protein